MRALVTGAGGFIGSHLTEKLVAQGIEVRAFLRYTSHSHLGHLRFMPKDQLAAVEFVFGDLRDGEAVAKAVKGMSAVLHLGALIAIPYSYAHPREVVETNVMGTLNVLTAARDHQVSRVVHTSTSEVYGSALQVPMAESHPLQAQSPYSASKVGADKLVESFVKSFDVPAVTLRPFNAFGPRQSQRAVIPSIICQALSGGPVRVGDLTPTRDFTYVEDTADGFVSALAATGVIGETINLGSGEEVSIGDLIHIIAELIGTELDVKQDAERFRPAASEVTRLHADTRKAKAMLDWVPQTSLRDGLESTIAWVRQNLRHFYRPDAHIR